MTKKKIIIFSIIIIAVIGLVLLLVLKGKAKEESTTSYKDVKVSTMTIENTLTSSGEVTSDTIEIELNTSRKYKEIYFSEGSYITSGTRILKYTNGKYYTAPYDLVLISSSLPDSGDRITSMHNLQIKKTGTLKMTLSIDETEIDKVVVGQKVNITLNAYEDKIYEGTITFINQIGSYSSSGTKYTATVTFNNDGNVKLGMSGNVSITVEKIENAIAVPIEAIQTQNGEKYVVVVSGDETTNVTVETGISNAAYVEIKSGLEGTETVRMIETETSGNMFTFGGRNRESFNIEGGMQMPSGAGNYPQGTQNYDRN